MKIKTIKSQSRRDFQAIYECEHCGATHEGYGYDDANFHNNVILLCAALFVNDLNLNNYVQYFDF